MKKLLTVLFVVALSAEAFEAEKPATKPEPGAMVLIPGGEFTMGSADSTDMPPHKVRVDPFLMDVYEVTNAEYFAFCEATGESLPPFWGLDRFRSSLEYPDHPVIGVSYHWAKKYAAWAGKRLPTEAEWEFAARGGLEGLRFDNADEITAEEANFKKSGNDGPVAVGSYRPNGFGLYDIVGNVREHVADYWSIFEGDPEVVLDNPRGPDEGRWRVIRGGGWFSGTMCNGVTRRNVLAYSWSDFNVGFRCARDVDQAE